MVYYYWKCQLAGHFGRLGRKLCQLDSQMNRFLLWFYNKSQRLLKNAVIDGITWRKNSVNNLFF